MSEVVDIALQRLIRAEELRRDVVAYARDRLSEDELAIADLPVQFDLGDEDVDYEALTGSGGDSAGSPSWRGVVRGCTWG